MLAKQVESEGAGVRWREPTYGDSISFQRRKENWDEEHTIEHSDAC